MQKPSLDSFLVKPGAKPVSNFDTSQSMLATSQKTIDQYKAEAQQAETEAQKAKATTFADPGETAKSLFPTGGAILGGMAGGALGGLVSSPTVLGIPAGVLAGGAAGAAAGAAGGEALQQKLFSGKIDAGKVGKEALEYGTTEAIGGPALKLAGSALKSGGQALAKAVIPTSAKEAKVIQNYTANKPFWERIGDFVQGKKSEAPHTVAQTAFDKFIVGTESQMGSQAKRTSEKLWGDLVQPALKKAGSVDMPMFLSNVEQRIIKENPELSRQKGLMEALDALKEDYNGVSSVSLDDLQNFKEGWAQFVPDKAYRGKPIAGAFRDIQNTAASEARKQIYETLGPEVKQAYIDYGNLKSLQELGQSALTGAKLKGGAGSFISGILEKALVPAGTIGGQVIYKTGEGVELIGKPGARFIRDLFPLLGENSEEGNTGEGELSRPSLENFVE